jgi:hypothetical protein
VHPDGGVSKGLITNVPPSASFKPGIGKLTDPNRAIYKPVGAVKGELKSGAVLVTVTDIV